MTSKSLSMRQSVYFSVGHLGGGLGGKSPAELACMPNACILPARALLIARSHDFDASLRVTGSEDRETASTKPALSSSRAKPLHSNLQMMETDL